MPSSTNPQLNWQHKSGWLQDAADRDHCLQYMLAVTLLKGELLEYADYRDDSKWAQD